MTKIPPANTPRIFLATLQFLIPPHSVRAVRGDVACTTCVRVYGLRFTVNAGKRFGARMVCGWGMSAAGAFLSLGPRAWIRCSPCNHLAWRASSLLYGSARSVCSTCMSIGAFCCGCSAPQNSTWYDIKSWSRSIAACSR